MARGQVAAGMVAGKPRFRRSRRAYRPRQSHGETATDGSTGETATDGSTGAVTVKTEVEPSNDDVEVDVDDVEVKMEDGDVKVESDEQ